MNPEGAPKRTRLHRWALAAAALPPLVSLALVVSFATHMHKSLGGWPEVIGMHGFPRGLRIHAEVALSVFGAVFVGFLFVMPLGIFLCSCVEKWRPGLRYLGIFAAVSLLAFGAMQLAPRPFLVWWWD